MSILACFPKCLHWPFCPGVFIAIMGFLAAIVTFWEHPPRLVKAFSTALFFALMCGEVWMMSKDRDQHDKTDQAARDVEQTQSTMLGVLVFQSTTSQSQLAEIGRKIEAAKGNPQLVASLRTQAAAAQLQAHAANRQLLLAMTPGLSQQLSMVGNNWYLEDDSLLTAASMSDTKKAELLRKRSDLAKKYLGQIAPVIGSADYVRQELLKELPSQTNEDKQEAPIFAKVMAGDLIYPGQLIAAGTYLRDLVQRVASLPK